MIVRCTIRISDNLPRADISEVVGNLHQIDKELYHVSRKSLRLFAKVNI